jgi:hypothetical protein
MLSPKVKAKSPKGNESLIQPPIFLMVVQPIYHQGLHAKIPIAKTAATMLASETPMDIAPLSPPLDPPLLDGFAPLEVPDGRPEDELPVCDALLPEDEAEASAV